MTEIVSSKRHCLREPVQACRSLGLNAFEEGNVMRYPDGDVMNQVARGAIIKNWNGGLRNPQAKKLATDVFNSGCDDTYGCVGTSGFRCPGSDAAGSAALGAAYDFLNAPYMADSKYQYDPPGYMTGIKGTGPNSVTHPQQGPGTACGSGK